MVQSAAARHLQCMAHTLQCVINGDDSVVFPGFVPGDLDL